MDGNSNAFMHAVVERGSETCGARLTCRNAKKKYVNPELKPGLAGSAELLVGEEHTAPRIGSGRVHVLATPVMINLIEAAALAAVEHLLPPGYQSLGTVLQVRHVAATPVGMRVRATAEVTKVDGRALTFRVEARDERDLIGDGMHERVIVNVERFDKRVQEKLHLVERKT
jgi:predicted thioesterase